MCSPHSSKFYSPFLQEKRPARRCWTLYSNWFSAENPKVSFATMYVWSVDDKCLKQLVREGDSMRRSKIGLIGRAILNNSSTVRRYEKLFLKIKSWWPLYMINKISTLNYLSYKPQQNITYKCNIFSSFTTKDWIFCNNMFLEIINFRIRFAALLCNYSAYLLIL